MEIPLRISHEGIFYVVMVVLVVVMNYNSLEGRFIWDDRAAVVSGSLSILRVPSVSLMV